MAFKKVPLIFKYSDVGYKICLLKKWAVI